MSWPFIVILAITALFYAAFPGLGAFLARGQWRVFRRAIAEASGYPTASPLAVGRERSAYVGCFRFFGTLEAIQGEDRIWITNGRFSVAVYLRNVRVYSVPEGSPSEDSRGDPAAGEVLRSAPWNSIFSLPEGTPMFVAGALFSEEGRGVFREHARIRLLVVIHECPPENLLPRAISGGRHRNELVNPLTVPSVAIGTLSLMIIALSLLGNADFRLEALLALSLALGPVTPFLPPAFPLYFAYRATWRRGRELRAQRDMLRSPLRYFGVADGGSRTIRKTLLPDAEPYLMIRGIPTPQDGPESEPGILCDGARYALPRGTHRLEVSLPRIYRRLARRREWVVFSGFQQEEGQIVLRRASDPMAEQLIVPGDPEEISRASDRAARGFQTLSGLLIILDIAVNYPLLVLVLTLLIR